MVHTPVAPAAERAEQAKVLSQQGAVVAVRDHAVTGKGSRDVACLKLQSRAPCPWWERPDPYWITRLFAAQRSWMSADDMGGPARFDEIRGSLVLPGQPDHIYRRRYTPDPHAAQAAAVELAADPWWRAVAVVRGAGRALNGQISALADIPPNAIKRVCGALSTAEVLESAWHHAPGLAHPRARVWQINDSAPYRAWARRVVEAGAAAAVYGPMPMTLHAQDSRADPGRGRNTRHCVLAAEAALRVLEVGAAFTAWMPEAACKAEWFLPPDHPGRSLNLGLVSDGCLIRRDGARVFLEIEASSPRTSTRVVQRIRKWSALFARGGFGGLLLFVAAGPPDQVGMICNQIRKAVEEHSNTRSRPYLLVGSWLDYSPDHGLVSADCARLRAGRYNGRSWEECDAATTPVDSPEAGIVMRAKPLAFTPDWAYRQIDPPA